MKDEKVKRPHMAAIDPDGKDNIFGEEEIVEKPRLTGEPTGGVNLSFEQMQELMATMAKTIVAEMKKPTEEELEKKAKEAEDKERRRLAAVQMAETSEKSKKAIQAACGANGHKKENGTSAVSGQVHGDGMVHPVCLKCAMEFVPFKATTQMIMQGANLMGAPQDYFNSAQA